jgi:hypothetical protein
VPHAFVTLAAVNHCKWHAAPGVQLLSQLRRARDIEFGLSFITATRSSGDIDLKRNP